MGRIVSCTMIIFFFPTEMSIFLKTEKGHFSLLGCIAFSSVVARTEKDFPGKV